MGPDVRFDRPMRLYTTFRIGGKAAAFAAVKSLPLLERVVSFLRTHGTPWVLLGKGSNVLVSDDGIDGLVIRLGGDLAGIGMCEQETCLRAGGGVPIRRMLDACEGKGLGGLEYLAGIPGTAGGAVAMNAGAMGREIAGSVRSVDLMTFEGGTLSADADTLGFSYRSCSLPDGAIVTGVLFKVQKASPERVRDGIRRNLELRRRTQPVKFPSAGSVFRNPPGDSAGRLVEKAGLKGKRVGGAEISTLHANFIVNRGGAKASDVLSLMRLARDEVFRGTGIKLEPEVRLLGFEPGAWPCHGSGLRSGPLL